MVYSLLFTQKELHLFSFIKQNTPSKRRAAKELYQNILTNQMTAPKIEKSKNKSTKTVHSYFIQLFKLELSFKHLPIRNGVPSESPLQPTRYFCL